ncbi:chondroitin proteoglycan-2-like [Plodia interpunctella]|uniref:chondroitin proteoglycan-2-like n=1 Tax=Plodia interpunctella TaxID=58824 RepID=UPI002368F026|nr:chondroitin proteoglycan-2-like [Plodia interpunctella]
MKGTGFLLLFAVNFCSGSLISHEECSIDSQLIPHKNCNQYYQCVHGALMVRNCSSILYFNPETQECDWPANVDCSKDDDLNNDVSRCSSGKVEGQFFAHENCSKYYRCVQGNLIEHTCHLGLLYNNEISQCDWPYNVDCKGVTQNPDETEPPVTESEKPNTDITPSPDDSNENKSDEESSKEESKSQEDSSVEDSSDESHSSKSDSDEDSDSESDSTESNSNEGESSVEDISKEDSTEEAIEENVVNRICALENSEGLLIPHEDCRKFYICAGGKPVIMNCPTGLYFDADTEQCNWHRNIYCGNNRKLLKTLEINVGVIVRGKKN